MRFTFTIRLFFPRICLEKVIEVVFRVVKPDAQQRTNEKISPFLIGHPVHTRKLAIKGSDEAKNGTRFALAGSKGKAIQF
jgi:hypothetical protein